MLNDLLLKNQVKELIEMAQIYQDGVITIESWQEDNKADTYSLQSLDDVNIYTNEDESVINFEDTKCGDNRAFLIDKIENIEINDNAAYIDEGDTPEIQMVFDYMGQKYRILNMV